MPPGGCAVRQQQHGRGHTGAQGGEHAEAERGRLQQGVAQGRAHKRSGAGAGHEHRQDAREEAAGGAAAPGQVRAQIHVAATQFDKAAQAQAHDHEQVPQRDHHAGRLQVKAPTDGLTRAAQTDQQQGDQQKAEHDAEGVQHPVAVAVRRRRAGKSDDFQRQDGQHAGHQIEDQPAGEGQQQHRQQRGRGHRRGGAHHGRRRGPRRDFQHPPGGIDPKALGSRGIAQPRVGAALRSDRQLGVAHAAACRQRHFSAVVIHLDAPKVLVFTGQRRGVVGRAGERLAAALQSEAKGVPIEVVTGGHLPDETQAVRVDDLDRQRVGLGNGQKFGVGGRVGQRRRRAALGVECGQALRRAQCRAARQQQGQRQAGQGAGPGVAQAKQVAAQAEQAACDNPHPPYWRRRPVRAVAPIPARVPARVFVPCVAYHGLRGPLCRCGPHSNSPRPIGPCAVPAMPSRPCRPGHAVPAMRSRPCGPGHAVLL